MDNSFSTVENSEDDLEPHEYLDRGRPLINKRNGVSQRLRASVQNVTLLPNRASVRQTSDVGQDTMVRSHPLHHFEQQLENKLDPESEKASALYQQARKIIHLCNAAESTVWTNQADQFRASSPLQESSPCSLPVMAPPVSRVRLPPSCPTSVHQRYPCPPAYRAQPASGPPTRPASRSSSRSASPRATTWARQNSAEEIIPSVSFGEARSVFCQNGPQQGPQGQTSRTRLPIIRGTKNDGTPLTHAKEKDPFNL